MYLINVNVLFCGTEYRLSEYDLYALDSLCITDNNNYDNWICMLKYGGRGGEKTKE